MSLVSWDFAKLISYLAINKAFPYKLQKSVTFGTPRVGNGEYAKNFDAAFLGNYTAVTNGSDCVFTILVPHVVLDYTHPSSVV